MEEVNLADPDEILNFLADVSLQGKGLTTDSLMDYVMDEGFVEPIYLSAKGVVGHDLPGGRLVGRRDRFDNFSGGHRS